MATPRDGATKESSGGAEGAEGAGLFIRYHSSSSSSESGSDHIEKHRKKEKRKKERDRKRKKKKKKKDDKKKKKKKKKQKRSSEGKPLSEDPEAARAAAEARERAGLGWMSQPHLSFTAPPTVEPQVKEKPRDPVPAPRPIGLYDPKKTKKEEEEEGVEEEEEVDEFGRSRPVGVKRPREVLQEGGRDRVEKVQRMELPVEAEEQGHTVTTEMLNKLVAQALKAQLKGDMAKYAALTEEVKKTKLKLAAQEKAQGIRTARMDSRGRMPPSVRSEDVPLAREDLRNKGRRGIRFHQNLVDKDGGLKAYFESEMEESKKSVQELLRAEKASSRDDLDDNYLRNMVKLGSKFKDPMLGRRGIEAEEVDTTLFESNTGRMTEKRLAEHQEKLERKAQQRLVKAEESSPFSFSNPRFNKALVMSTATHTYLMLAFHPVVTGHCRIVPLTPVGSLNDASDEVFEEIGKYKRSLEAMAMENGQSLVYMETVMKRRQPGWHTCLECIPVEEEVAEIVPMCFKRALLESDEEWSTHQKVLDTSSKSIRNTIPVGFPYFHVEWGGGGYKGGGYAHVIEDPTKFPSSFGVDVLLGAMGTTPSRFNRSSLGLAEEKKRITEFQQVSERICE